MIAHCQCGFMWNVQPFRSAAKVYRTCAKCSTDAMRERQVRDGLLGGAGRAEAEREAAWAAHEAARAR